SSAFAPDMCYTARIPSLDGEPTSFCASAGRLSRGPRSIGEYAMFRASRDRFANPTSRLAHRPRRVPRPSPGPLTFPPGVEGLRHRLGSSTLLVTNSLDNLLPGSLRYAISQANLPGNNGSTVRITPQVTHPIVLTNGELPVNASMTIENLSGGPVEIRQETSDARVFHVAGP